jgi:hypothetical protein
MSRLKDTVDEENAIRSAGNMEKTLDELIPQLETDELIITEKEQLIADSVDGQVPTQDLLDLTNARTRTVHGKAKMEVYKTEFPKLKTIIKDNDLKSDIDLQISRLE